MNTNYLVIAGMLGAALQFKDEQGGRCASSILLGEQDQEIRAFIYYRNHNRPHESEAQLNEAWVTSTLENLKSFIRANIQQAVDAMTQEHKLETANQLKVVIQQLKASQQPSDYGTVAEIAARYGVSKSEVRRHKAEGNEALGAWLNTLEAK